MIETFHEYKDCQIAIKQTMKRHKGQRVRTIGYRFHIWIPEELGRHQYISKKSEALATETEAFGAAQQVIDIIFKLYAIVAKVLTAGEHLLRVDNLDGNMAVRGYAETRFSTAIDSTVTATRGSELIAAHLREVDPHGQYLTEPEANDLYRAAGGQISGSDIDPLMATDAEVGAKVGAAVDALKLESDPLPQYLGKAEGDAAYLAIDDVIPTANIPSTQATDAEVDSKDAALKATIEAAAVTKYRQLGVQIPSADIDSLMASDLEVAEAVAALKIQLQNTYPIFKRAVYTLNCPAGANSMSQLAHGLTSSKIKSFSAFATVYQNTISEMRILPSGGAVPWIGSSFKFWVDISPSNIVIRTDVAANSQSIFGAPVTVTIDYTP